jgi:sec-independent protein translocase protein TatB
MPQIGWFEILIIVAIAIIVIGPKDFPLVLKKIGSWIGSAKRYVSNIQREVSDLTDDNFEIKNLHIKTSKKKTKRIKNQEFRKETHKEKSNQKYKHPQKQK